MIDIYKKIDNKLVKLDKPEPDCWINIYPPFSHQNLEQLSEALDIPIDFLKDSLDLDERSRYEIEDNVKLIVLNTPIYDEELFEEEEEEEYSNITYITVPIGIILVKDIIITISPKITPVIESFINQRVKHFDPSNRSLFVIQLFDRSVYYFLQYLKQLNNRRHQIEDDLIDKSTNKELTQLLEIQKTLVYFVNTLKANELMMMKIQRVDFLKIKDKAYESDYLEDVIIDNRQALEMSNVYSNILTGTMDVFASIISNNLNTVVKRLTSVTIVLMVPTLVTSFYGMNVHLPLQDYYFAWIFTLFLSVALSVLLIWFFVKQDWF